MELELELGCRSQGCRRPTGYTGTSTWIDPGICFRETRLEIPQLTTLPMPNAIKGTSVARMIANRARIKPCSGFPPREKKLNRSIPITATKPRIASPRQIDQMPGRRVPGNAQTTNSMQGKTADSQIECIETNALVGGNQPQSPQKSWGVGISTLPNNVEPKTSDPMIAIIVISFLKNI